MRNKPEIHWWKFALKRSSMLLVILFSLGFTGCSDLKSKSEVTTDGFQIKTANPNLRNSFKRAKTISDSLARIVIAPEKLGNFYCRYYFEYYDEQKYENDSIDKAPINYHFTYYLLTEGDTIGKATVSLDSTLSTRDIGVADFIGLKYLLEDKLAVDKRKAFEIGKQFGVDLNASRARATATFFTDGATYDDNGKDTVNNDVKALTESVEAENLKFYWVVENYCDGCMTLNINAETEVVSNNHRYMFVY